MPGALGVSTYFKFHSAGDMNWWMPASCKSIASGTRELVPRIDLHNFRVATTGPALRRGAVSATIEQLIAERWSTWLPKHFGTLQASRPETYE